MKKGQIFDVYREGSPIMRCMAINNKDAVYLETLEIVKDVDFENEVDIILIDNIFKYPY